MSARTSTELESTACSGAMYPGVPNTEAAMVWNESIRFFETFATPRSRSRTVPSGATIMFSGFRSRWTSPSLCAASRTPAIWSTIPAASGIGCGPPSAIAGRSVSPIT